MDNQLPLIRPMLAVSSTPFDSSKHLFEIKWDGYRALAYLDNRTTIRSRNLLDLSAKFPELGRLHQQIKKLPAVLDGEIVVFENGKPSFAGLQSRWKTGELQRVSRNYYLDHPAVFMAFDVLYSNGNNVMEKPLEERKILLEEMLIETDVLLLSRFILKEGRAYYDACVRKGLEGVVAKRLDSKYFPGRRTNCWQKFKNTRELDLVICGYEEGGGSRLLGSLVLGGYRDGRLVYQGKAGTGFNEKEATELLEIMVKLQVNEPPLFIANIDKREVVHWLKPVLVCTVGYLSLTSGGYLRHPVYKGLRLDKAPEECKAITE